MCLLLKCSTVAFREAPKWTILGRGRGSEVTETKNLRAGKTLMCGHKAVHPFLSPASAGH